MITRVRNGLEYRYINIYQVVDYICLHLLEKDVNKRVNENGKILRKHREYKGQIATNSLTDPKGVIFFGENQGSVYYCGEGLMPPSLRKN